MQCERLVVYGGLATGFLPPRSELSHTNRTGILTKAKYMGPCHMQHHAVFVQNYSTASILAQSRSHATCVRNDLHQRMVR